jgi:hypothetical protein
MSAINIMNYGQFRLLAITAILVAVVIPLSVWASGALVADSHSEQAETLEWSGSYGGLKYATEIVAKNQTQWEKLWARISQKPPVPLDACRDMAVGIFLGTRPTGGYGIVILSAKEEQGVFVVRYREIKIEDFATQALTTPYLIKLFPQTDLPVTFKKDDEVWNIKRQTYEVETVIKKSSPENNQD